jgi:hypothetical protein
VADAYLPFVRKKPQSVLVALHVERPTQIDPDDSVRTRLRDPFALLFEGNDPARLTPDFEYTNDPLDFVTLGSATSNDAD